jgi:hypothetical protein
MNNLKPMNRAQLVSKNTQKMNTNANIIEPKQTRRHSRMALLVSLVALVCGVLGLVTLNWDQPVASHKGPVTPPTRNVDDPATKLRRQLDDLLSKSREEDQSALDAYRSRIADTVKAHAEEARAGVSLAVEELGSFRGCAHLSWLMAKDQFTGQDEAQEQIGTVLTSRVLDHFVAATRDIDLSVGALADRLARNSSALHIQAAALVESAPPTVREIADLSAVAQACGQAAGDLGKVAVVKTSAAASLALEALFIQGTFTAAKSVLAAIVKRIGATAATSLTVAVADGPLPVGDIIATVIAAGGGALCAWDIYEAREKLASEITPLLCLAVERQATDMVSASINEGERLLGAYQEINTRDLARLQAKL